jgi:hypothetical protein
METDIFPKGLEIRAGVASESGEPVVILRAVQQNDEVLNIAIPALLIAMGGFTEDLKKAALQALTRGLVEFLIEFVEKDTDGELAGLLGMFPNQGPEAPSTEDPFVKELFGKAMDEIERKRKDGNNDA